MRIAVGQTPGTTLGDWPATRATVGGVVARAARRRVDLVVLPECVWPAYCLESRAAYFAARAGGMPGDRDFLDFLCALARRHHIGICAGYVEEAGDQLYNAAGLIDRDGVLLGRHRKCFLWDSDRLYFEPGESLQPLATPWGPVGLMICADARLPEIPATLVARGARLLLHPTGWVNVPVADASRRLWNPQPDFLIPARAAELGVPIASASKWGWEASTEFVGSSLICGPEGATRARCGQTGTAVVAADVTPSSSTPPAVTCAERAKLLALDPPAIPRPDVPSLLVVPTGAPEVGALDESSPAGCVCPTLVIAQPCHAPSRASSVARLRDHVVLLRKATDEPLEVAGVRIGAVTAPQVRYFARVRCLALAGAHVVVVFGEGGASFFLRARACENRVFMIGVGPEAWTVVDPSGQIQQARRWDDPRAAGGVLLDVGRASGKEAAPGTDVICGRCPEQYQF